MRYQVVEWIHSHDEEPVLLYSEIDGSSYERRKVEQYRGGRMDVAGPHIQTGSTYLGAQVMPPLEEINSHLEFSGRSITPNEFEAVWKYALAWFDD